MNHWDCRYRMNPRKPLNTLCCSCPNCKYVIKSTAHWFTQQTKKNMTIKLGDRVLVQGLFTGTVKYVGDLDRGYVDDQTFIGVKLDEPVGKSDGVYEGKRFFQCPNRHGVIVPIHHIHLLVPREGPRLRDESKHPKSYTMHDASKASFSVDGRRQCLYSDNEFRKYKKFLTSEVTPRKYISVKKITSPDFSSTSDCEPESTDQEGFEPPVQKTSRKINLPKCTYDGTQSASAKFSEKTGPTSELYAESGAKKAQRLDAVDKTWKIGNWSSPTLALSPSKHTQTIKTDNPSLYKSAPNLTSRGSTMTANKQTSTNHAPRTSDAGTHTPTPETRAQASMTAQGKSRGTSPTKKRSPSITTQTVQYRSSSVATDNSLPINKLASTTTQTGHYRCSSVAAGTVDEQASTTTQTGQYRSSSVAAGTVDQQASTTTQTGQYRSSSVAAGTVDQQASTTTQTVQYKHSSVAAGSSLPIYQNASATTQTAQGSSVAAGNSVPINQHASATTQTSQYKSSSVAIGTSPATRNQTSMTFQDKAPCNSPITGNQAAVNANCKSCPEVTCKNRGLATIQCKSSPAVAGQYKNNSGADNAGAWPFMGTTADSSYYSLAPKMYQGKTRSATEFESNCTADSNVAQYSTSSRITQDPSSFSRTQNTSNIFARPKNFSGISGMQTTSSFSRTHRTESYPHNLSVMSEDYAPTNCNSSSAHFSTAAPPSCFISSAGESRMATAGISTHPPSTTDISSMPSSFMNKSQTKSTGPFKLANIYKYCGSSSSSSELRYEDFEEVNKAVQKQISSSQMVESEDSDSKLLLSGLTLKDSGFPPPPFNTAMDKITRMRDMVDKWGGGERGFHMALTLQKLNAARLKGMKEVEWQKELQLMDKDSEFSARKKVLDSLKAEILETRRKSAIVNEQTKKTQALLNGTDTVDEIDELKAKIQKLQRKNATTLRELNRHPIACGDIVRKTISRITEEYKERKRNISETCGPHSALQCN